RNASAQTVWAASDGEKIERDDLRSAIKRANSVWDGRVVKIFGARNEIIAFQLIVEANGPNIAAVRYDECARGMIGHGCASRCDGQAKLIFIRRGTTPSG
nr:hypothetical protein [Acidobacteriota bacterium]